MGTRSLTVLNDEQGKEICVLYRQMDGYPSGHGQELAEFLQGFRVTNGYTLADQKASKVANGANCLAAQIIAHFKDGIGGFYLYPAGSRDHGEEYIYTVYYADADESNERAGGGELCLRVDEGRVTFFGLPGDKQEEMKPLYDGPVRNYDGEKIESQR